MATFAQRTQAVEERVDSLETTLTRFMARTDESMAHTDRAIARLERIVERFVEEGARARERGERDRREMNQRWGELANKMGTVVEDIVAPSVRRLARSWRFCVDGILPDAPRDLRAGDAGAQPRSRVRRASSDMNGPRRG